MSRRLRIWKIALAQIILILMYNKGAPQQIARPYTFDQITIMHRLITYLFNVPQIPRMSRSLCARATSVVCRPTNMQMFTGAQAAFASQIPRLMNMKSMQSLRQLRKGRLDSCMITFQGGHGLPLNPVSLENSHGIHVSTY
jgi:hypothetical protein